MKTNDVKKSNLKSDQTNPLQTKALPKTESKTETKTPALDPEKENIKISRNCYRMRKFCR